MPALAREPRWRHRAAAGLLMAAAALIVGGCGGAVGGGAVGGKAGPGAQDRGSSAGLAGRTAGPGATASAGGSGLAGRRPVSAPAGSPLSARWTGDGKPVTLAFGGMCISPECWAHGWRRIRRPRCPARSAGILSAVCHIRTSRS